MTLAAPRSREGKAFLVLAIFAAVTATVGALFWASQASADLPTTTVTLAQSPDSPVPGTVAPGGAVTYDMTLSTTGTNSSGAVVMTLTVDGDLGGTTVTCLPSPNGGVAWVGAGAGTGTLTCTSAGPTTNISGLVMHVAGAANGDISAPSAANVHDGAGATIAATPGADVGTLTVGAGATVADATNFPGVAHTFVFTLAAGVTCLSDVGDTAGVSCNATDVTVGGTVVCTPSAPTVVGQDVSVTITPTTGAAGTCTVTLALYYEGAPQTADGFDIADVTATKTYDASVAGGTLCHLDIPDAGSEDAAGNTDGILYVNNSSNNDCVQDDVDDAIGSFHAACIEGSSLTYAANSADITWNIIPIAGGPAPNPPGGQSFAGPSGEPCVQWGAGTPGTQNITATYAPGAPSPSVNYYWNEYCLSGGGCFDSSGAPTTAGPLPLIKEWNVIDDTKIINSSGDVGDTLADNTGGLAAWASRDCVDSEGICGNANLNGTTVDVGGVLFPINGSACPDFSGGCISASGESFIDYTMGHHADVGGAYDGPVDGALQNYSVEGDCGSVRLEDPTTGNVHKLFPGDDQDVLSSDKGVGFQILPNADGVTATTPNNADCQQDSCVTVTILTQEDNLFHSPPLFEAGEEVITVCFHVGPPTNKQPLLAWAGQRVVLEHDWSFFDQQGDRSSDCPYAPGPAGDESSFFVRYLQEFGNGGFVSDFGDGAATGPDFMVVRVSPGDSDATPNADCISRVMYESQDQGEQDVVAHVVECSTFSNLSVVQGRQFIDPDTCAVVSEQVAFLVYYMKFEDITLKLIPDETTHDPGSQSSTAVGAPSGADSTTANVSANVLARATVRGWTLTDNCPARASAVGSNGEFIPANRCIFPDDWLFKAGGNASDVRKNYDNYGGSTSGCSSVAGPYSLLDPIVFDSAGDRDIVCSDSMAPHAPFDNGHRDTNFPDGSTDANDAPMPSALIRFLLSGSGFLLGTEKSNPTAQFNVTHIPAEPWIAPTNADLSGYQWNSWGTGNKSGVYHYWTDLADHGPEVISCAGTDPCDDGVATGGYLLTRVYSDEHGVAMTWINGDANLTFDECASSAAGAGHQIVLLNGFFCEQNDVVGHSTLNALADYPDKRKHFAILSGDVSITWTWGGIKDVTVEPDPFDATGQFHYVVLHVTDRDGFCQEFRSPSGLHPVLPERVDFRIDSTDGVIFPDQNGNEAEGPPSSVSDHGKQATTTTFYTSANQSIENGGITVDPVQVNGECQAWIHVSESLLNPVNVIVTAYDPEGTVTFDTTDINPTPTPSPTPSPVPPTPSPVPTHTVTWGDWNCSGAVNGGDAVNVDRKLVSLPVSPTPSGFCPTMGTLYEVTQDGLTQNRMWGDTDCSGSITGADAIKIDRALVDLPFETFASCPGLKQVVTIPAA